jgi:hypothetical protein
VFLCSLSRRRASQILDNLRIDTLNFSQVTAGHRFISSRMEVLCSARVSRPRRKRRPQVSCAACGTVRRPATARLLQAEIKVPDTFSFSLSQHLHGCGYGVVSSPTVQEVLPSAPVVHVQRHSLISGSGGPSSFSVRNFPPPVGAPTGMVLPFPVGAGTLQDAQAFASHLLPLGACGWYWPNT